MNKKLFVILLILVCALSAVSVAQGEEDDQLVTLTVLDKGKIIFQEEYKKNPEFFSFAKGKESERAREFGLCFGNQEFCDYIFDSLGMDISVLFGKIDMVTKNDCIIFNNKNFTFSYDVDKSAYQVDKNAFFDELYSKLGEKDITIDIKRKERQPLYSEGELKILTQKIGEYETGYANSIAGRKKNIRLASNKLSGIVIGAGESFSFNSVVGKRTKENGFEDAKVILNGEYVEGIGGGVCQVATTVYNALLVAGFTPISCTRHTLAPSYVPLSFDAMVSEYADLKMRNDTGAPVYIGMSADGEKLKAVVFGKKGAESYRFESEIIETLIHADAESDTTSVYKNGYKSRGYKLVYKNGALVKKILLREDVYKPYKIVA